MDPPLSIPSLRPLTRIYESSRSQHHQRQPDLPSRSRRQFPYYVHLDPQLPKLPPRLPYQIYANQQPPRLPPQPPRLPLRPPYQIYANPLPPRLPPRPPYQVYAEPQPPRLPPRPLYQIYANPLPPRLPLRSTYQIYADPQPSRSASRSLHEIHTSPVHLAHVADPTFHCGICLETYPEVDVVRSDPCAHVFCRNCVRDYIRSKLKDRQIPGSCPSCMIDRSTQEPGTVNHLAQEVGLDQEDHDLWSSIEMESVGVNVQCPRCEHAVFVDRPEYDKKTILACPLPNCKHLWCKLCQGVVPSMSARHSCDGSVELDELVKRQGWKRCPGCRLVVQKASGCNHVKCRCNTNFCYRCGGLISQSVSFREVDRAVSNHFESCQQFER